MKISKFFLSLFAGVCAFNTIVSGMIVIDTSYVDDANNANDSTGYGRVTYEYYISTHEVTNAEYTDFLNAKGKSNAYGLWNSKMSSENLGGITRSGSSGSYTYATKNSMGEKPVNFVSFWDAARFSNWLTNGQGDGDTETGMYTLGGVTNPDNETVAREQSAWTAGGVAIANENEWYKAAYYDPEKDNVGGYWLYAHQSNSISNTEANYNRGNLFNVGHFDDSDSYYGTYDQGGNLWEWIEDVGNTSSKRVRRGGGYGETDPNTLKASNRYQYTSTGENRTIGIRLTSLDPIPEPSAYSGILGGLALAIAMVRRKGEATSDL